MEERVSGRLYWRAVVHPGAMYGAQPEVSPIEWHAAACSAPRGACRGCEPVKESSQSLALSDGAPTPDVDQVEADATAERKQ